MTEVRHRFVETNGIRMHVAEQGSGPSVLLLHGFPESWYSWRHQLQALADAGYHAVAPDQRGYGQTDRPDHARQYTQLHLTADVIGLLDALGMDKVVLVGHDWGAPVAWHTALFRPDRVRGVVGLSVPYVPRTPVNMLEAMRSILGDGFYMWYFQRPGVADAEFERDVRLTMRKFLYTASGDVPIGEGEPAQPVVPEGVEMLDIMLDPPTLPAWLTEQDLEVYASQFERSGFTGGLNWYRAIELSWELMAPWDHAPLTTPALYMVGDRDVVYHFPGMRDVIDNIKTFMPNLRKTIVLEGCGHWTQQERPEGVNRALIEFLRSL